MNTQELTVLVNKHIGDDDKRICTIETKITNIEKEMKNKVSYKIFFWVFGILLSVLTGLLGYLVTKVDSIQQITYTTGKDVAEIQGIFKQNDISLTK